MKFLLLFCMALPLFGAKILDYNIYPRDDRVDLTFSFDTPYDGGINQSKKDNILIITLDAKTSKEEDQTIDSNIIKKVKIFSQGEKTLIALNLGEKVEIKADSIGDKFGLRLRAQKEGVVSLSSIKQTSMLPEENLQTNKQEDNYDFTNYILVMSALLLLLIGLWVLKIYLRSKYPLDRNFNLIFQRPLDRHNQLIVFEYGTKRYTMVIGNSNLVLETSEAIAEEKSVKINSKEKDFNSYFEENKQRLQNLLLKQK